MQNKTIAIIHISDIHLVSEPSKNPVLKRLAKIYDAIKNGVLNRDFVFLVISGDVAFSGKEKEYDLAATSIINLVNSFEEYLRKKIFIVGIPGNHDCDFQGDQTVREAILGGLESKGFRDISENIIGQCCAPQKQYFEFQKKLFFNNSTILFQNQLLTIVKYESDGFSVIFNCFNTAWTSKFHEEEGKMNFPINLFDEETFNNDGNLNINIIHHPLNWQNNFSHRDLKKFLDSHGDITLSGHEHVQDLNSNINSNGDSNIYIEAGALQDSNNGNNSTLNLININYQENNLSVRVLNYSDGKYIEKLQISNRKIWSEDCIRSQKYTPAYSWSEYLDSTSSQLIHRRVEKIYLDDIFVSPFFKELVDDNDDSNIINFDTYLQNPYEKIILVGEESSGKTTLCKKLFKFYHGKGKIPILIHGEDIRQPDWEYIINELIKKAFSKQYNKVALDKFESINLKEVVLIIDNFSSCTLKDIYRRSFVHLINENFENIVYTGNNLLFFNPITDGDSSFGDYKTFIILESSYEIRYKLIKKWNALGENQLIGNELARKNETYDNQIKNFLSRSFLPHYPFIILVALQSIDTSDSSDQGFSFYYKYLVDSSLKRCINNPDELQFYHYFLSSFCFMLFESKIVTIHKDDFEKFFRSYVKEYNVNINFTIAYEQLIKSKTIKNEKDFISLYYHYIYYYYTATYISLHIDESHIRSLVRKLIERLYVDDFSNIIVFLTQLSNSPFILEALREFVNSYFSDFKPADLNTDISGIDSLMQKLPDLLLLDGNIENQREDEIIQRSKAENIELKSRNPFRDDDDDLEKETLTLTVLKSFIRGIKTFEIYSQVIKRNWGAYNGKNKTLYVTEAFDLAMRTLSAYIDNISNNNKDLIEYIYYIADKRELSTKQDVKKLAGSLIFNFLYISSHGLIKRLASSIAHQQLKATFSEVVIKNPTNANKLIQLCITLDQFGALPMNDIKELLTKDKTFNKYYLTKMILRSFVYQYLHLYEVPHEERSRICSLVGIKIGSQRRAQIDTSQRKKLTEGGQ